jgi:4-hydroxy-3-polyprenylbenzoate decarboxylase
MPWHQRGVVALQTTVGSLHLPSTVKKRIIVAITGASGAVYGLRLLQMLREMGGIQTYLIVSDPAWLTVQEELNISRNELEALADMIYSVHHVGAPVASGSFLCDGMVIAPCSMRTLAAVAHGLSDNLITRAADVTLKERRRLILMVRETPLNLAHLRNMLSVTEMGGIIFPPVPGFYQRPQNIDDLVTHTVIRVLAVLGLPQANVPRWTGLSTVDDT